MHRANQHHEDVFPQGVASQQTTGGMGATKKANGPKGQQAQTHRRHKAWQEPRSSQTNMDLKHKSKQEYTCIKEIIQTLYSRPRFRDIGLDHKI